MAPSRRPANSGCAPNPARPKPDGIGIGRSNDAGRLGLEPERRWEQGRVVRRQQPAARAKPAGEARIGLRHVPEPEHVDLAERHVLEALGRVTPPVGSAASHSRPSALLRRVRREVTTATRRTVAAPLVRSALLERAQLLRAAPRSPGGCRACPP